MLCFFLQKPFLAAEESNLSCWSQCSDCCCNSCNRGSSYCAFPRFTGEDIGDETRNFVFWMCLVGFFNFAVSYSIWANYGSPR